MAEPKARTLIQQLGFFDKDLKTDTHDQIMIWVQENANSVINRLLYKPWSTEYLDNLVSNAKSELANNIPELEKRMGYKRTTPEDHELLKKLKVWEPPISKPKRVSHQVDRIEWEKAIDQAGYSSRKFTIGFIDMVISYSYQDIRITGIPSDPNKCFDITAYSTPKWKIETYWDTLYIEVKAKILSAGELMRQINLYRNYRPGKYLVISPDTRFREILASQGVKFIAPFGE